MKVFLGIIGIIIAIFALSSLGGSSSGGSYNYDDYEEVNYEQDVYDSSDRITSDNWECTVDCSGHEAGYEWAANNGITDPNDCGGNSDSFIEGCEAYANEYQMENEYYEEDYYYDSYY